MTYSLLILTLVALVPVASGVAGLLTVLRGERPGPAWLLALAPPVALGLAWGIGDGTLPGRLALPVACLALALGLVSWWRAGAHPGVGTVLGTALALAWYVCELLMRGSGAPLPGGWLLPACLLLALAPLTAWLLADGPGAGARLARPIPAGLAPGLLILIALTLHAATDGGAFLASVVHQGLERLPELPSTGGTQPSDWV